MIKENIIRFFVPLPALVAIMIGGHCVVNSFSQENKPDYNKICTQVAREIESQKEEFPQLTEFVAVKNLNIETCVIEYDHNCQFPPKHLVGWRSGVPQPNDDGIWFYISIWDEDDPDASLSQINTQPAIPSWHMGNRRVTYLMLSGRKTIPLYDKILNILKKHGMREL